MRPDARVQAAIEVFDRWRLADQPAERVLADWGRANRFAGSGDRRAIGDLIYGAIRQMRSAAWLGGSDTGRGVMAGVAESSGADLDALFNGVRHAPAPLSDEEREGRRALAEAPWGVRFDLPDWLEPHLGHLPSETLVALVGRAPLDLRVNSLKAEVETVVASLAGEGMDCAILAGPPGALRVTENAHRVARSEAYSAGLVEIQDASSQKVARFAAPRPGDTVIDLCAGGGGKTLAMAALMENRGKLYAHDIAPARLAQLPERAQRAGARVALVEPGGLDALAGTCDLALVDAPCSGSGAWRRTPEAKWALTLDRLVVLNQMQDEVLAAARKTLRPGGRLVYATCSLIEAENDARITAFLTSHPEGRLGAMLRLDTLASGDGFFATELVLEN